MKMYKKPTTEVMNLQTARLMDQVVVSPGSVTDPSNPPQVNAPKRGDLIP